MFRFFLGMLLVLTAASTYAGVSEEIAANPIAALQSIAQPTVDQILAQTMEYLNSAVATTGGFLSEQTPLFIQECYNWFMTKHILSIILEVIVIIGVFIFLKFFLWDLTKSLDNYDRTPVRTIGVVLGVFTIILLEIFMLIDITYLAKLIAAPRLYLLTELANLLS